MIHDQEHVGQVRAVWVGEQVLASLTVGRVPRVRGTNTSV